jgi:Ca2+-binding EF-hand superfamily protein
MNQSWTNDSAMKHLSEADENHDGLMDEEEFIHFCVHHFAGPSLRSDWFTHSFARLFTYAIICTCVPSPAELSAEVLMDRVDGFVQVGKLDSTARGKLIAAFKTFRSANTGLISMANFLEFADAVVADKSQLETTLVDIRRVLSRSRPNSVSRTEFVVAAAQLASLPGERAHFNSRIDAFTDGRRGQSR